MVKTALTLISGFLLALGLALGAAAQQLPGNTGSVRATGNLGPDAGHDDAARVAPAGDVPDTDRPLGGNRGQHVARPADLGRRGRRVRHPAFLDWPDADPAVFDPPGLAADHRHGRRGGLQRRLGPRRRYRLIRFYCVNNFFWLHF